MAGQHIIVHRDSGSSPHAWGASRRWPSSQRCGRFIPTCVGSIRQTISRSRCHSVHPHMRGEHAVGERRPARVWRFIPTCVGSILSGGELRHGLSVHPHMRGEHSACVNLTDRATGSSPHAWGALRRQRRGGLDGRFIPTCVGSMRERGPLPGRVPVHPHMRGEHSVEMSPVNAGGGSSPHAWGASRPGRPAPAPVRFIPTCVGSILGLDKKRVFSSLAPYLAGQYPLAH